MFGLDDLAERVRAQLDAWGLADSPEGAAALDIALRLQGEPGSTEAAQLHGRLHAVLASLRKLAPVAEGEDEVDELAAQREQRRRAAGIA